MNEEIAVFQAMLDDEFRDILQNDPVLKQLDAEKFNARDEYFELMAALSKTYLVDGVPVSCITPAVWSYLYAIQSPYATEGEPSEIDTDIFLYILHNGVRAITAGLARDAAGFCREHGMDWKSAENDLRNLIYLAFRPLEMLQGEGNDGERARFNLDWLTHLVSVVAPLTNKTADEVIYDTSLTECFYYVIQKARQFDDKGAIRRRDSGEINEAIYMRTLELGKEYYAKNYLKG